MQGLSIFSSNSNECNIHFLADYTLRQTCTHSFLGEDLAGPVFLYFFTQLLIFYIDNVANDK